MKLSKMLLGLLLSGLFFTSCKKDDASNPAATVDSNGNLSIDNAADGALYSVKELIYGDATSSNVVDESHSAFAWFGKQVPVTLKDAGKVTVNDVELDNIGGSFAYYMYFGFDQIFPSNASHWTVEGNSSNGVDGFDYTDNQAYPAGPYFTLPAKVNINSNFTITHTPINGVGGIVYTVIGSLGQKSKAVQNGASSVTFTPAEMKAVAYEHDAIGFSIMPVVYTFQMINGKKYYFVKELQYARETETL